MKSPGSRSGRDRPPAALATSRARGRPPRPTRRSRPNRLARVRSVPPWRRRRGGRQGPRLRRNPVRSLRSR
ncbi:hypothetical protein GC169_06610 [bacterium]|nr:hypothetical protein [bacterium]